MNIPIEYIGIGAIILLVVLFSTWKVLSHIWLKRRYKPENDKSRLGEEKRRRDIAADATIRRIESGKSHVERPTAFEKRESIQTAAPDKIGQNRPGVRKLGTRRFIRRRY